jgi:hypothetical protein
MPFPMPGLNTALFALILRPNKAQQFQKNAYHNDKCVISEPPAKSLHIHPEGTFPFNP